MPIDPTGPYALEGRIVTMGPAGVIDEGLVFIRGETIVDVRERGAPRPDGFSGAPVVKVGGTLFPGLIELHNHLSYNAIPFWDVPRKYAHSGSWQGTDVYKTAITKPAQVLANTAGNTEALVRFVECRCLLGGVTTSQGVTLSSAPGITTKYKGLVRNVESPLVNGLAAADARIGAPDRDLDVYEEKLRSATCYLQHLSEGLGDTPRAQFTGLQRPGGSWALHDTFCGVHSTALAPADFQVLAQHGGSIVWSPLSNLLLYGGTTDVAAAKQAGLPIALGSDWAPSGTKNLLGELKVAWLVSEEQGGIFTRRELCEMVTTVPAAILRWGDRLGSIEAGKLADLIVLDDTDADPFQQLIEARETSVTLVVIGGVPRAGQVRIMRRFGPGTEEIRVGSSKRVLDLSPSFLPDPLAGITLSAATERLRDSLARLPELAEELDSAVASGWLPGRTQLPLVAGATFAPADLPADWQPPAFSVVLDFEAEDVAHDPSFALAAGDLAEWVDLMELEGITVADDADFFRRLARARNLPAFVKTGLPPLYGEPATSLGFLDDAVADGFDASVRASREMRELSLDARTLRLPDRLRILDEAVAVLERYYVHLPMKRAMHAVDPVQRLRVLRYWTEQEPPERLGTDLEFHRLVSEVLHSVRDLHTLYRLPHPYRRLVAWLPYLIEECFENDRPRFIVSKLVGDPAPGSFRVGVEILHWNGTPIGRVVDQLAREMPGGNEAARRARALNALTVRPLASGQVPAEDWVTLHYRADGSPRVLQLRQPWLVFEPSRRLHALSPEDAESAAASLGLDDQTDEVHQAKKLLYAAPIVRAEEAAVARGETPEPEVAEDEIPSRLPTVFRARRVRRDGEPDARYGYLRIFSFNIDDADVFVDEFERLLGALPDQGLIVDVRGNGGGLIYAAERVLELMSPCEIEPERAQFINSAANLELCRRHAPSRDFADLTLASWIPSMAKSVATGATWSLGFPITDARACNARGQRYQGPVALIVDGLCYSATDMFAAGFQDHQIGKVIGIDTNTGAGGANVWSHALLRRLAGRDSGLRRLPGGADLRVAIRRTQRVGPNTGELLEDLGVRPDLVMRLTRMDLLEGNRDLVHRVIEVLEAEPHSHLRLLRQGDRVEVEARGVDWVTVSAGGRPVGTWGIEGGRAVINLAALARASSRRIDVIGLRENRPVARARLDLGASRVEEGST